MSIQPQSAASPAEGSNGAGAPAGGQSPGGQTVVQTATAAESAVVIQVGGDLYLSDAGLTSLWTPQPATPGECPYPGLDAFGPGQARWFYGRETLTGDLLRYLDEMTLGGPGGPLLVVAPSGTGKSSLLGAGLLTALAEGRLPARGSASWPRVMITPGPHPLDTLRAALATLAATGTMASGARVILVIDQLEEIFTVCESERERAGFLDEVGTLAADAGSGATLVVLGMRADFYARATGYPVLRQAMQARQVVLGAMSATEVRQAIVRPARAVGLTLEAGLTERLLRDLGVVEDGGSGAADGRDAPAGPGGGYEPGRLPLLAHALRATWQLRDGSRLTIAGYERAGGIAGAIARTAEDVYARLDEAGRTAARQLFLGLVRVGSPTGDGDADTRKRVAADGLLSQAADPAAAWAALEAFTQARLLTSGGQAVEITHEALLHRWPRLRSWIDEDRSGLLVRQELEDAAAAWAREGRDAAALYGGVRLAAAQAWAAAPARARELTQAGRDFLAASERRRRRGTQRRNGIIAGLAALSLVLAGLSVVALNERSDAQSQRNAAQANFQLAEAGLLAAENGQAGSDFRPDTAQKFAVEADRLDPSSPQVRSALISTQTVPIVGRLLTNGRPENSDIVGVAYNPAGTIIAGTTQDDRVQLWSAATYRLLSSVQFPPLSGSNAQANGVVFTPDGKTMIVAQKGGPWVFDISNPAHPVHAGTLSVPALPGLPHPQVTSIAVSPDGKTLVAGVSKSNTSFSDGEVLLWNVAARTAAGTIPEQGDVDRLAFTPDGRYLVTETANGGIALWNFAARSRAAVVQAPTSGDVGASASGIAASPSGQVIAYGVQSVGKNDVLTDTVKLWSISTQKVIATLNAGQDGVNSLAFSPDGTHLAEASLTGTVRLWSMAAGALLIGTFAGHRSLVEDITFSPDGREMASASDDGTIDVWDTQWTTLGGRADPSIALAFSPDGKTLALSTIAATGAVIALYAMPARKLTATLPIGGIAALAFSPDGKTLAVMPFNLPNGGVELWSVATGKLTGTFTTGFTSHNYSIAFSPDGTQVAVSGAFDATIQVWSATSLKQVAAFSNTQQSQHADGFGGAIKVAFSPDGRLLAADGRDGVVRLYSVPGYTFLSGFEPPASTSTLAFSPDSRHIATGSGTGNVYLWSLPASDARPFAQPSWLGTFAASTKQISSIVFQSSSALIASGFDGVVRFWTVPATQFFVATTPTQTLATRSGQIGSIAYSAPLGLIATGTPAGSRVWQTNPARVAASICAALKAPVQPSLWQEYLPTVTYTPICGA